MIRWKPWQALLAAFFAGVGIASMLIGATIWVVLHLMGKL